MAKLYAEVTSDKGGRVVGKSGNEFVSMDVRHGNKIVARVEYNLTNKQLHVCDDDGTIEVIINGYVY